MALRGPMRQSVTDPPGQPRTKPSPDPSPEATPMARRSPNLIRTWAPGAWGLGRPRSFQVTLVLLSLPLMLGIGALRTLLSADHAKRLITRTNDQVLAALAGELGASMTLALNPALSKAQLDRLSSLVPSGDINGAMGQLPALIKTLGQAPNLSALFIANDRGEALVLTRSSSVAPGQALPPGASWTVGSLRDQAGKLQARQWVLGRDQRPLAVPRIQPLFPVGFDPRLAPWYQLARRHGHAVMAPVSRLDLGEGIGLTLSQPLADGKGVVGATIDTGNLAAVLTRHHLPAASELAIVDHQGLVLATSRNLTSPPGSSPARGSQGVRHLSQLANPALAQLAADLPREATKGFHEGRFNGQTWFQKVVPLQSPLLNQSLYLAVAVPEANLMAEVNKQTWEFIWAALLVTLLSVWLLLQLAGRLSRDLKCLAEEAAAMRGFQFDTGPRLRSGVREVDDLSLTLDGMGRTIGHFLEMSASLGAERDVDALLARLLKESIGASGASAGALYLEAAPTTLQNPLKDPLANAGDGDGAIGPGNPDQGDGAPDFEATLLMVGDQPTDPKALTPIAEAELAFMVNCQSCDLLVGALGPDAQACMPLPLRQRDRLLGVLVLWFNGQPDANQIAFSRALSGSAAVALETRQLIAEQKRLFEAFIQVIAGAIDAKSPYTGGHCARVPEIAKLLAAAACEAMEGPFADFQLDSDQWEALHLAAWLHDCGKVTTPDHVVDKATKLETVQDRIHEIRMRFELLKSEAESEHWRRIATGSDPEASQHTLQECWRSLDDDFAFVADCNLGGERMAPERIERLQAIASRTWRRSLDDRLGVGPEELRRRQRQPAPTLPVREPLLADRPDQRIERPERDRIAADNPWGFQMEVPDLLYNRGELHNLTVERGTLSREDRFKINEHMVHTIRMLSALPFPRHLAEVPEIAGAHHETLDGRGYPRRLPGEQMGVLARVMAIADIFEALTAADRPYKRGLKLSEALAIMGRMVQDQHIDGDLFALFLRSQVYLSYAERHMEPGQIDGVDLEALLAPTEGGALTP